MNDPNNQLQALRTRLHDLAELMTNTNIRGDMAAHLLQQYQQTSAELRELEHTNLQAYPFQDRQSETPGHDLREAVDKIWASLPTWITTNINTNRLIQGEPHKLVGTTIVEGFPGLGDTPVNAIDTAALARMQKAIKLHAGQIKIAQLLLRNDRAPSYEPDDYGHGAENNFVQVAKRIFSELRHQNLTSHDPATQIGAGGRNRGLRSPTPTHVRRALENNEINRMLNVIRFHSTDPTLDALVVQLGLRSGARREGILGLTLAGIDLRSCTATTHQKYGKIHARPVARSVLRQLRDLALARGAEADHDPVFRLASGKPMTSRHLDTLWRKVQQSGALPVHVQVSTHWLRHCTLTWLDEIGGEKLAEAWAAHVPNNTIGKYLPKELPPSRYQAAARMLFGALEDELLGVEPGSAEAAGSAERLWRSPRLLATGCAT